MKHRLPGLALICAGLTVSACVPDLSGWEVTGSTPRDATVPPRRDGGPVVPTSGGPCARPTLFAAVQELGGGGGRVMRWEIQGSGGLVPCGDVLVDGRMNALPFAVAALSETSIIVASRAGVIGIDPVEDRALFDHATSNLHPNDAFVVEDGSRGGRVPVVAWSSLGASADLRGTIRLVEAYGSTGDVVQSWSGSDLVLGAASAMTASPNVDGEALALNPAVYTAGEVDLWDAMRRRDPSLIGPLSNASASTIAAGRSSGGTKRLVWSITIRDEMTGVQENGIAVSNDPWGSAEVSFETTGRCGEDSCDPIHAVLDPTLEQAVFVICEGSPRRLYRFDIGAGVCEIWADATSLGTRRLSYLTVLP